MRIKSILFSVMLMTGCVISIAVFTGCKKNNNNSNNNIQDTGSVKADVGNIAFQSGHNTVATDSKGTINISGYSYQGGDTSQIQISFPDTLSVNVANHDATGLSLVIFYYNFQRDIALRNAYNQATFTITLSSFDKVRHTIAGTFSGTLTTQGDPGAQAIQLGNGYFNTSYTPITQ